MKQDGYEYLFDPDNPSSPIKEFSTCQCAHCGMHFRVGKSIPVEKLGGFCRSCFKPTCTKEKCNIRCEPTEKWISEIEEKDYKQRQYNLMINS